MGALPTWNMIWDCTGRPGLADARSSECPVLGGSCPSCGLAAAAPGAERQGTPCLLKSASCSTAV